jgi:anti-sigma factor RsiW
MNCNDFELLLADALGGELTESDRPAFERHMAECASCRADYQSTSATVSRLRALSAAEPASARVSKVGTAREASWGSSVLRYAASIVIAFAAGYGANGLAHRHEQTAVTPPATTIQINGTQLASASFGAALAETYQRRPGRSDLSRCLSAMFSKQD